MIRFDSRAGSGARVALTICVALAVSCGRPSDARRLSSSALKAPAKNVIVLIADGSGFEHMRATSYFLAGAEGALSFESFPFTFAVSTYSWGSGYDPALAWSDFDYVMANATDAGAGATALATGVKTYDGAIGVDHAGNRIENAIERAEDLGKSTGVVTTVELSHAVTAAFVAHNADRDRYQDIAEEMVLSSEVDVIMGAGHPWFDDDGQRVLTPNDFRYVGGQSTWDALVAGTAGADADSDGIPDPWTLVQSRAEFQSLATGNHPKRVIGVAPAFTTLQQARSGDSRAAPFVVPLNAGVPTLAEMTRAALNILDDDPEGLFLVVVGGAVDWASHSNQAGRLIEEEIDFDGAVQAAAGWVESTSNWGETLLIVTSTHETGYLTGPGSDPLWNPVVNNGAGEVPGMEFHTGNHTNSLVPLYAKGSAAHLLNKYAKMDPVRGKYVDNTEIGATVLDVLGPGTK